MKKRLCVVCGAKVNNINPKCVTCSATCTRAKHNGLSRVEQEVKDVLEETRLELLKDKLNLSHPVPYEQSPED
jgi:primosomal protein N'